MEIHFRDSVLEIKRIVGNVWPPVFIDKICWIDLDKFIHYGGWEYSVYKISIAYGNKKGKCLNNE
jgi:hypothetical protein